MEITIGSWRVMIERIPFTKNELVARYDHLAMHWHRLVRRLGYQHVYTNLFAMLRTDGWLHTLHHGSTVLDGGIGSGDLSLALAAHLSLPPILYGVDIAPHMLRVAEQRLHQADIHPRLVCDDLQALRFPSNSFDLVISAHALEHLPAPRQGLCELVRVLRPGAPLVVLMTRCGLAGWLIDLHWRIQCARPAVLIGWLQAAGLTNVRWYVLNGPPWCQWMSIACVGIKAEPA